MRLLVDEAVGNSNRGDVRYAGVVENRGNVDQSENACGLPWDRLEMSPFPSASLHSSISAFLHHSLSYSIPSIFTTHSLGVHIPAPLVLFRVTAPFIFRSFASAEVSRFAVEIKFTMVAPGRPSRCK